jgi:hypothetical protein
VLALGVSGIFGFAALMTGVILACYFDAFRAWARGDREAGAPIDRSRETVFASATKAAKSSRTVALGSVTLHHKQPFRLNHLLEAYGSSFAHTADGLQADLPEEALQIALGTEAAADRQTALPDSSRRTATSTLAGASQRRVPSSSA